MMKVALVVVVPILLGGHYGSGMGWEVLMCGVVFWVGVASECASECDNTYPLGECGLLLACRPYKVSDNLYVPKAV